MKQRQIGPAEIGAIVNQRKLGDAGDSVTHTIPEVELGGVSSPAETEKSGEGDLLVLITKGTPFRPKRIEKLGKAQPARPPRAQSKPVRPPAEKASQRQRSWPD